LITHLSGHHFLGIGLLLEIHRQDIGYILREFLEHETQILAEYTHLLELVNGRNVLLEEYARRMMA
jgi:bacterioferritin